MDKEEVTITLELLTEYHLHADNNPNITKEFIFFENVDFPNVYNFRFIISQGLYIGFLRKGKVDIQINMEKYTIEAPAILTVFSDFTFESYVQYPGSEVDALFISLECIYDSHLLPNLTFLWKIINTPVFKVPPHKASLIHDLKIHMIKLFKLKDNPLYDVIMKNILYAYLMEISCNPSYLHPENIPEDTRQREITNNFFRLLGNTRPIQRGVSFYADELCISTRSLYNAVKSTTGIPVIKWINLLITFEAKKTLKSTDLSIDQISEMFNFKSTAFFISFFKKAVGVTPLNYRKL